MARNHRGQKIADPYLNARREMLEGMAYDPEEEGYDEAFGPTDRTFRSSTMGYLDKDDRKVTATQSDFDIEQGQMEARRSNQGRK